LPGASRIEETSAESRFFAGHDAKCINRLFEFSSHSQFGCYGR